MAKEPPPLTIGTTDKGVMMRGMVLVFMVLVAGCSSASVKTVCLLDKTAPVDTDGLNLYHCGSGEAAFSLRCDGSTDAEYKTQPFKRGTWSKENDQDMVAFAGGFVACSREHSN